MLLVDRIGKYSIKKDGTTYYRVFFGRKRIASVLFREQAYKYIQLHQSKNLKKNEG